MLVFILLIGVANAASQSCSHTNACYSSDNTDGFTRCVGAGGEMSELGCCDDFCKSHPGYIGCGECEPVCPASSIYCPIVAGDERPECVVNECIDGHCQYGGAACGSESSDDEDRKRSVDDDDDDDDGGGSCPCVCGAGHENTACTAHPIEPPQPCHHTIQCGHLYKGKSQRCVRDTCIIAPDADRGHTFWDSSSPCDAEDVPCVCESTGQLCEYVAPTPAPTESCSATCDYDPQDSCIKSPCVRSSPHQHYGTCQFDSMEHCITDADCQCVCSGSHLPCTPLPTLCPSYTCPNETAGTECHYQYCKLPFGESHGACTLCGSPCEHDSDCPCVCNGDKKTRCTPPTTAPTSAPTTTTTTTTGETTTTTTGDTTTTTTDETTTTTATTGDTTTTTVVTTSPTPGPSICGNACPELLYPADNSTTVRQNNYCTVQRPVSGYPGFESTGFCALIGSGPFVGQLMCGVSNMDNENAVCGSSCSVESQPCECNESCSCKYLLSDDSFAYKFCVDETSTTTMAPTTAPETTTTNIIDTPCCSQETETVDGITILCQTFDGVCDIGWEPNTNSGLCDDQCNKLTTCCESLVGEPALLNCDASLASTECESIDGTTSLTFCEPDTCQPKQTCCYSGSQCQTVSLYDCAVSDDGISGANTGLFPCSLDCEPIGCCVQLGSESGVDQCSEVTSDECLGEFRPGPCCPGNAECCETPTPAPTPAPTPFVCNGTCPLTWFGYNLAYLDRCTNISIRGSCLSPNEIGACKAATVFSPSGGFIEADCSSNSLCAVDGTCQCDSICSCLYEGDRLLPCNYIPSTPPPTPFDTTTTLMDTTTGPPTTSDTTTVPTTVITTAPTPTPAPTGAPCDDHTACGVRPGCKGGTRNNKECITIDDCPGATACVPLKNACQIDVPCTACEVDEPSRVLRSCHVCLHCTADEHAEQAVNPQHDFPFRCCPLDLTGSIDGPVPPENKCDRSPGAPSDCAREYNCVCRTDECDDQYDTIDECLPLYSDVCSQAYVVQEGEEVQAKSVCGTNSTCPNDFDFYLLNVTEQSNIVVYITQPVPEYYIGFSNNMCSDIYDVNFVAYTRLNSEPGVTALNLEVPPNTLVYVRLLIPCDGNVQQCVKYTLSFQGSPPTCPDSICAQQTCLSAIDCGMDSSCFACDNRYGRCIERSNCTCGVCDMASEVPDTCIDAIDDTICKICDGPTCSIGNCRSGACTIVEPNSFPCNCRCPRVCWKDEDCEIQESRSRMCDTRTGTCVYRLLPMTQALSALRAERVVLDGQCMRSALDASERGYTAYAMDRFGSVDQASGQRRPSLCGGSVETQQITIDANAPSTLQADCCHASASAWLGECFHGDTSASESGHTWVDRAWYLMHQARLLGQQGHTAQASAKACCASLIWASVGKACGRDTDAWSLGATDVTSDAIGPVAKWFEDGAGDGDTNDAGLYVFQATLKRGADIVAVNTHTYMLARGGGFEASLGLAFGASGAFVEHRVDESTVCPDRERRLARSVLDQTATRRQIEALPKAPVGSLVGVIRHVIGADNNAVPAGIADAECFTVAGAGSSTCRASQFVPLYPTTASALPLGKMTLRQQMEFGAFREPVVNTQSGTPYQAPLYAASASYLPAKPTQTLNAPFVLRNHDCGVSILDGDQSTLNVPLVVTIPASAAQFWRWPSEGTRLIADPHSNERMCRSGPLSGAERCSNDATCEGGTCALPPSKTGVPYPYAAEYYSCVARRVDCSKKSGDHCCSPQVQQWYLYAERSKELLFESKNK